MREFFVSRPNEILIPSILNLLILLLGFDEPKISFLFEESPHFFQLIGLDWACRIFRILYNSSNVPNPKIKE